MCYNYCYNTNNNNQLINQQVLVHTSRDTFWFGTGIQYCCSIVAVHKRNNSTQTIPFWYTCWSISFNSKDSGKKFKQNSNLFNCS